MVDTLTSLTKERDYWRGRHLVMLDSSIRYFRRAEAAEKESARLQERLDFESPHA